MKVIISLLALVGVALGGLIPNLCPPEQAYDWTIEKLLPHSDCGKYYQCTHGRPIERICPAGLHFNVQDQICDWPYLANCTQGLDVVPAIVDDDNEPQEVQMLNAFVNFNSEEDFNTDVPEISTPEPTTRAPIFGANGCPIDPYAHWLLPHESDCNKFYSCVWGQKVEMKCLTPNLHFNPAIQVCDWPSNAGCNILDIVPANS